MRQHAVILLCAMCCETSLSNGSSWLSVSYAFILTVLCAKFSGGEVINQARICDIDLVARRASYHL